MKDYNGFSATQRTRAGNFKRAAQKSGDYPTPSVCESCGQTSGVLHSHNEDYTNPLDAYDTCYICHMMIHCRFNSIFHWREYVKLLHDGAIFHPISGWDGFKARFLSTVALEPDAYGPPRMHVWLRVLPVDHRPTAPPEFPDWARSAHWRHLNGVTRESADQ